MEEKFENLGAEQNQQQTPNPTEPQQPQKDIGKDARYWAMWCHLAGFAGFPLPIVGFVLGPLMVWLHKKHDHPFIDQHGKEAVNFQISMFIYMVLASLLITVCIGAILLAALAIADVIFIAVAASKASDGELFCYPMVIKRFVK